MQYAISFEKTPVYQIVNRKRVLTYQPLYTAEQFSALEVLVQDGLADAFVGFQVTDNPESHAVAIDWDNELDPDFDGSAAIDAAFGAWAAQLAEEQP